MTAGRGIGGVFVAGIAAVGCVAGGVAGLAVHLTLSAVVEREGMAFKEGGAPGLAGVAVIAALAKETGVNVGLLVAGGAARRRAAVLVILVAVGALNGGVLTGERKHLLVVEPVQPVGAVVADQAVLAVLLGVFLNKGRIFGRVAGQAGLRVEGHVAGIFVAGGAGHGLVLVIDRVARQGEARETVVKCFLLKLRRAPAKAGVAGSAVAAKQAGMRGGFLMAAGAGLIGLGILVIAVALLAGQRAVFAHQRKVRIGMVKRGQRRFGGVKFSPAVVLMASRAGMRLR